MNLSVDELVEKINAQLGGVEEVIDLGARYLGAVIVKVVECEKHPNADRLNVCKVDDGGVTKNVERDENGHVQVVCGAPNVRTGIFVVWLPPGSTVPASFTEKELFVLSARELRGVVSQGMLASAKELGLGDSHDGILELDETEWKPSNLPVKPGESFARVYGLDDTVIDIENKMFTHRPDCFGVLGVAREIAGIQHKAFTSPAWYKAFPDFNSGEGLELTVKNDASTAVPRFMVTTMKGITIKPSPVWLQAELVRLGGKPISNIVDVTNYVMLLTGQPTHAYDYDKLRGKTLAVRMAQKGEQVSLLNGKSYKLDTSDIVIVDGEGPVGLGGIMGGGNSEVSDNTKNIVLECANFDMYAVRRSSMRHGLFTDAVTRFNKGQSPLQNDHVLSLLMMSVHDVAGGEIASQVYDARGSNAVSKHTPVHVSVDFINDRLGSSLTAKEMTKLLSNVEFDVEITVKQKTSELKITAPFWRTDIEIAEDIVEEVGRMYGFDALPRELPRRRAKPVPRNPQLLIKNRIRQSLKSVGASEVLTYSFVSSKLLARSEQDISQAFQIANALSPDLEYYRLSVLPSLLDKVHSNIKAGHDEFVLYEIGKGHNKKVHADDDDKLPTELEFIDAVYTSKKPGDGAPYYRARRLASQLAKDLGFSLRFTAISDPLDFPVTAPFDLSRSAIIETREGVFIGMVGELKPAVLKNFKLPSYTSAMTLDLGGVTQASLGSKHSYQPLSKYPSVTQDISLKVPTTISYKEVFSLMMETLAPVTKKQSISLKPLSIYQSKEELRHKTITLRLKISDPERTLTDKEVSQLMDEVAKAATRKLEAERI